MGDVLDNICTSLAFTVPVAGVAIFEGEFHGYYALVDDPEFAFVSVCLQWEGSCSTYFCAAHFVLVAVAVAFWAATRDAEAARIRGSLVVRKRILNMVWSRETGYLDKALKRLEEICEDVMSTWRRMRMRNSSNRRKISVHS